MDDFESKKEISYHAQAGACCDENTQSAAENPYAAHADDFTAAPNCLEALLYAEVGALYIDEHMRIRKLTPIILQNTNLQISDLERPVTHINFLDSYPFFNADVETVFKKGDMLEKEVTDKNNATWLVRLRPCGAHPRQGGVLVTMFDITKPLKAAKSELKRLTDSVPSGVSRLHYDDELFINYANDSFYTLLQYNAEEVRAKFRNRYNRLIEPLDWAQLKKQLEACKLSHGPIKAEYRVFLKDGSTAWCAMQAVLYRKDDRVELQCIITDITLLKSCEDRLKKERDYYNALYQNMVCGVIQYENAGNALRCCNANEKAVRILGYASVADFRAQAKQALPAFTAQDDVDAITQKLLALRKEGECVNFEHRIKTRTGEIRWISGTAKVIEAPDGKLLIQSAFMDVTEEKRALQQLRNEREQYDRLHNILYNMPICGIIQADVSAEKVVNINREALHILGVRSKEHIEKSIFTSKDALGQNSLAQIGALLRVAKMGCDSGSVRMVIEKGQDEAIVIEGAANQIAEDGGPNLFQFTFLNVTERERLKEAELRLAVATQANEAKSAFLSKISHEIRTPMNGITGMLDSAILHIEDQEKTMYCLGQLKRSMTHLRQLLNDVLDMSKIESGKMTLNKKPFDLKTLLTDIIDEFHFFAREQGVGLSLAGSILHSHVISDSLRLREVLDNLIGNAIKFTDASGWVILTVDEKHVSEKKSEYTFRVKDTGCGISKDDQKLVFDVFEQGGNAANGSRPGCGLGLAICKNLTHILGGKLHVQSVPGEGSEFWFTLLLEKAQIKNRKKAPAARSKISFSGMRVLVAEDNQLNAEILQTFLVAHDCRVEIAPNGKKALELFKKNPDYYYNLILMDIQMPVLNGYETTRHIRASGKGDAATIPIIATSANAFSEDVEAALAAGMNGHIAKPVDMQTLLRKLKKILDY